MRDPGPLRVVVSRNKGAIIISAESHTAEIIVGAPEKWLGVAHDFAAFMFLPIAMRAGRALHVDGAGDPTTAENANALSRVWEVWQPELFQAVEVTFEKSAVQSKGAGELVLFSGGVDSTFNILEKSRTGARPTLLTIQGFDYGYDDRERFEHLMEQTRPFVDSVSDRRISVHTNIYRAYEKAGVEAGIGHGFALASCLFLFSDQFEYGEISADYTPAQDFIVHPWGTNHLTNEMFASSTYRMRTGGAHMTRAGKTGVISSDPVALKSLSFCVDYSSRPHNCGKCSKCVRTKAMFVAQTGSEPAIFVQPGLTPDNIAAWNFDKKYERAFFQDLYQTAHRMGNAHRLPGIEFVADRFFGRVAAAPTVPPRKMNRWAGGVTPPILRDLWRRASR